jgi:hypothetical protein
MPIVELNRRPRLAFSGPQERAACLDSPKPSLATPYRVTLISGGMLVPLSATAWQRDAAPLGFQAQAGRLW